MNIDTVPHLTRTVSDYGYINARVRSMKSLLLSEKEWIEIQNSPDLKSISDVLSNHPIGKNEENSNSAAAIEKLIRQDLCQTTQKLLNFMGGRPRQLLNVLLSYWDKENIKAILRGKHVGSDPGSIERSIYPLGKLNEALLHELIKASDLEQVISILATWRQDSGKILSKNFPAYKENPEIGLVSLELSLDQKFFEVNSKIIEQSKSHEYIIQQWLSQLKDIYHLRTAYRIGQNQSELHQCFMGAGKYISKTHYLDLASASASGQGLEFAIQIFRLNEQVETFEELERTIERKILKFNTNAYHGDPLGFDIPFGFLWLKLVEARDLRILIHAKSAHLAKEDFEKELFYEKL